MGPSQNGWAAGLHGSDARNPGPGHRCKRIQRKINAAREKAKLHASVQSKPRCLRCATAERLVIRGARPPARPGAEAECSAERARLKDGWPARSEASKEEEGRTRMNGSAQVRLEPGAAG